MLWHYRRTAGMEMKEAASRAGVDLSTWSKYEAGKRAPPRQVATLRRLARAVAHDTSDLEIKFEMLCRSAGYLDLLPSPRQSLAGLPRYLPPDSVPLGGYLDRQYNAKRTEIRLLGDFVRATLDRIYAGGFGSTDLSLNIQGISSSVFGVTIEHRLIDDAFSAFYFPLTRTICVNPNLGSSEARQAVAHELSHLILQTGLVEGVGPMDAIVGCNYFENLPGEASVNCLSAMLLVPEQLIIEPSDNPSRESIEYLAKTLDVPPEAVFCQVCVHAYERQGRSISPSVQSDLLHRFPGIIYYW